MTYPFTPEQEAWLRDLETTGAKQGVGKLHYVDPETGFESFCCLGRACIVFGETGEPRRDGAVEYYGMAAALPSHLKRKLRLRNVVGGFDRNLGEKEHLASLNDAGWTFKAIAAYIRANPDNVFLPPEE